MKYLILIVWMFDFFSPLGVLGQDKTGLDSKSMEPNVLSFLVFNIHTNTSTSKNLVKLISKKDAVGKAKRKNIDKAPNYLALYSYETEVLLDSIFIEHPLVKHIEYLNGNNAFTAMDTVLNQTDFFIRVQGKCTEMRVFEKLKDKPLIFLNSVKI
jgi:hypothetical protein